MNLTCINLTNIDYIHLPPNASERSVCLVNGKLCFLTFEVYCISSKILIQHQLVSYLS